MPLVVVEGPTIRAGESLSEAGADCSGGLIVRITMPPNYDDGDMPNLLSFQVSSDGVFYNDLFDDEGREITITARASSGIVIDKVWARSVAFIKFRSGTRDKPTKQKEDCTFAIAVKVDG